MKKGKEIKKREERKEEQKEMKKIKYHKKILACETPVFPTRTLLFSSSLERAVEALPRGLQYISCDIKTRTAWIAL